MMRGGYEHSAHLLAVFELVGTRRSPVLQGFVVKSETHAQITCDWSKHFYALVTSAHSQESYGTAVRTLRKSVQTLIPSIVELVSWGIEE